MQPRAVLVINAFVTLLFGLPLLLAPEAMLPVFGIEPGAAAVLFARDLGVTFLALTVLNWFGRDATGSGLRAILLANLFLQGVEAVLNFVQVAIGTAPAGVVPGELVRVVLCVLLVIALRDEASR